MNIDPINGPLSAQVLHYVAPGHGGSMPYVKVVDFIQVNEGEPGAVQLDHTEGDYWWRELNPLTDYERKHEVSVEDYDELTRGTVSARTDQVTLAREELEALGLSASTVNLLMEGH